MKKLISLICMIAVLGLANAAFADGYDMTDDAVSDNGVYCENDVVTDTHESGGYVLDDSAADNAEELYSYTHQHKFYKEYEYLNDEKHCYYVICKKCAEYFGGGTSTHTEEEGSSVYLNTGDSEKHKIISKCSLCGSKYTRESSHTYKRVYEQIENDRSNHKCVKRCEKCGYVLSEEIQPHDYKNGVCTDCSYGTEKEIVKAQGICRKYLNDTDNDDKLYANCPDCGSYECEYKLRRTVRRNVEIDGKKVTIYHQKVKCSVCGKGYYNKCYYE